MKISDLNKITFKDFQKGLKQFDWKRALVRVKENPWVIFCAVAALITFVAANYAFKVYQEVKIARNTELKELRGQVEAVKDFEIVDMSYKNFWENVPEFIPQSELIELLTQMAIDHNIQITSLSPPREQSLLNVNLTSMDVTLKTNDYANMAKFMYEIENSPYSIRAGKWAARLITEYNYSQRYNSQSQRMPSREYVEASMELQTVEFKNE